LRGVIQYVCFCLLIVLANSSLAQQQLGLMHGNYNVTEALRLNPAAAVAPLPYLDIHTVGVHSFIDNNFLYLPKDKFHPFLGRRDFSFEYNFDDNDKFVQTMSAIHGPAFNLSYYRWAFGAGISLRTFGGARKLPIQMAEILEGDNITIDTANLPTLNEDDFRIGGFLWGELAMHVGRIVYQEDHDMITVGIRPKILVGLAGGQFAVRSFDYTPLTTESVQFDNVDGEFVGTEMGYAGLGFGVDLGVEYRFLNRARKNYVPHARESGCDYVPYRFKIGFSILDLGRIRMKNNSHVRRMSAGSATWSLEDDLEYTDVGDVVNRIDEEFGNTIDEVDNQYTMWLPTALSINGDYHYKDNWWVGFAALYGLPRKNLRGAEEMAFVSITPRYETRHLEFAAPVSVNRFLVPRVGLATRLGPIQFGTDNIVSYVVGDAYRLDFYFSCTIDIVQSNRCDQELKDPPDWRVKDCTAPKNRYEKPKKKKRKHSMGKGL